MQEQQVAFDATKSSTFKKLSGAAWKISYGDGSSASGDVGTDVIDLGGLRIENQAVELAKELSQQFSEVCNLIFCEATILTQGRRVTEVVFLVWRSALSTLFHPSRRRRPSITRSHRKTSSSHCSQLTSVAGATLTKPTKAR